MSDSYDISCDCGAIEMRLNGAPRVQGHCHCQSCRTLLNTPYHSVTAWNPDQVEMTKGADDLELFQHPDLQMKKVYCSKCGEVMFNTNAMDWRVVSQHLIAKNNNGQLPAELASKSHFFYGARIVDVDDELPKKT